MFKGSITALITPFEGEGVDYDAFSRLVEFQIGAGTHGLVPVRHDRQIADAQPR